MCKNGSVHSALVYKVNALSCQIVKSVQINRLFLQYELFSACFNIDHGLKHISGTILNELPHGVKVCGKVYTCRENTLLILAFALTVKLLPPLRYIVNAGFIVCKDFDLLTFS